MTMPTPPSRVSATPQAIDLIERLQARHGPVLFHQSGGCCDGSAPMCFAATEFTVGDSDVLLGHLAGAPVYMGRAQFTYWQHTHLIIDAVPGHGAMFSLEGGTGLHFVARPRPWSDEESNALASP